jgi:hypothetical protein
MAVACMLYRASRLVGITRRAPATVAGLGDEFRRVFEAYLAACPDADPDFDRKAAQFERFVAAARPVARPDPSPAGRTNGVHNPPSRFV